jgi:CRP-like cAMP-binding protein
MKQTNFRNVLVVLMTALPSFATAYPGADWSKIEPTDAGLSPKKIAELDDYVFSAEAMEPSTVCRFRKGAFRALVQRSPPLEHMLLNRTMHELAAAQNQMLLLGRKTAFERMASFLLDLPGHDPARPSAPGHVRLPMKRAEIADYLGLTIETVSRVLTRMKLKGLISTPSASELVQGSRWPKKECGALRRAAVARLN